MAESTVGWFVVREKYCSLVEKVQLISQVNMTNVSTKQASQECVATLPSFQIKVVF